jgi:hypothetical protein
VFRDHEQQQHGGERERERERRPPLQKVIKPKEKQTFHSDPLIFRVFDRHCIGRVFIPRGNITLLKIGESMAAAAAAVMFMFMFFSNRRADMCRVCHDQ